MPEKQEKTGNKFQMPKENAEKKGEKVGETLL